MNEPIAFENDDLEEILSCAETGRATRYLSLSELEFLLPILKSKRLFIPAMESYQRKTDDWWPARLDLSIYWEKPETTDDEIRDQQESENMVRLLVEKMRAEEKEMEIQIWLDELHPDAFLN